MDLHKAVLLLGAVICSGGSTINSQQICASGNGKGYRGTIAETWTGKTCQSWSDQSPHQHKRTTYYYPKGGLESNYCRNPDGMQRPWCYTTDPKTRWEYCLVPRCETFNLPELNCTSGNGKGYRGTIAVTRTGKTCQRWAAQSPHEHERTLENYPNSDLESNYCRNPDDSERPWCYTTDPDTRWQYCLVPSCASGGSTVNSQQICASGNGKGYRGTIAETWTGKTCQSWSDQSPHQHKRTTYYYPKGGLESNYCRNPDGMERPWCYTTDPDTRWQYCLVPRCETLHGPDMFCAFGNGKAYRGTIAETRSGKTCQRWSDQAPHQHERTLENYPHSDLESNYCRNPDGSDAPWCYTTDPCTRWEYCHVSDCKNPQGPESVPVTPRDFK
ncbi:plasminogen-like [Betta splendens]|uniref:Plasminogen-like n=1 Tax=Betta splendens TaxID=158456 RepID=A0A6P7LQQ8_BETSP|nr:plasminogen-like [Betta splendens]